MVFCTILNVDSAAYFLFWLQHKGSIFCLILLLSGKKLSDQGLKHARHLFIDEFFLCKSMLHFAWFVLL